MTISTLSRYRTLVFDCDGVILDSNRVKTDAFFTAALQFGERAARRLRDHHLANGGVSRYAKFEYFLKQIVDGQVSADAFDLLLDRFGAAVREGLKLATVAEGLDDLRSATAGTPWVVISGGDQVELRDIFSLRGLTGYFDGGIFGSPDSKEAIFSRCDAAGIISRPALYVGDSRYDHDVARAAGHDFVFVENWSEFGEWRELQARHDFPSVPDLAGLLKATF